MSEQHASPGMGPLLDLQGVLNATRRQAEEERRELAELNQPERLFESRARRDLAQIRLAAHEGDERLESLLGTPLEPLAPSEPERHEALQRLARHWARTWRFHDPAVRQAAERIADREDVGMQEVRERALQTAIIVALDDAHGRQVTRIGRDRAWGHGSELILLQKQDLKQLAEEGLSEELAEKLSRPRAGVRVFPPYRLLGPIEGAFLGVDPEAVRPVELRPSLFYHWIRSQSIDRAEEWLLDKAGLDPAPHKNLRQVEVIDATSDDPDETGKHRERVRELELLEARNEAGPEPLRQLLERERMAEVLRAATPSQRKILELLRRRLQDGLPLPEAKRAVADQLDVTTNRIDVAFSRVRKRAEDPL